jgi:hypothetical protein
MLASAYATVSNFMSGVDWQQKVHEAKAWADAQKMGGTRAAPGAQAVPLRTWLDALMLLVAIVVALVITARVCMCCFRCCVSKTRFVCHYVFLICAYALLVAAGSFALVGAACGLERFVQESMAHADAHTELALGLCESTVFNMSSLSPATAHFTHTNLRALSTWVWSVAANVFTLG